MTGFRSLTALTLALMLALTSLTLAVARGQAPALGTIILCSGAGMQALPVDADGNPTGPPHVCPDGVTALASVEMAAPGLPVRQRRDGDRLTVVRRVALAGLHVTAAQARGPPTRSEFS